MACRLCRSACDHYAHTYTRLAGWQPPSASELRGHFSSKNITSMVEKVRSTARNVPVPVSGLSESERPKTLHFHINISSTRKGSCKAAATRSAQPAKIYNLPGACFDRYRPCALRALRWNVVWRYEAKVHIFYWSFIARILRLINNKSINWAFNFKIGDEQEEESGNRPSDRARARERESRREREWKIGSGVGSKEFWSGTKWLYVDGLRLCMQCMMAIAVTVVREAAWY